MAVEKSWKEVHRILKLMRFKIKEVQTQAIFITKTMDEIVAYSKELYQAIPKHDGTLFSLSPIATGAIIENLLNQIFKYENPRERIFTSRIKRTFVDLSKVEDFTVTMDQALAWATKFEKQELEKIT